MAEDQDEKAKRLRELLSSFYGSGSPDAAASSGRRDSLQGINLPNFDSDHYMSSLLRKTPLDKLLQRHVEMAAEIKNLDSDMQMLVYENYNKFISATDTIRRMKENVAGMESNMDQLLDTVTAVRAKSDGINASLCERRERIEELNGTRSLLRKIQTKDYSAAVKYYLGALPILQAYGKSSFQTCKVEAEEIIANLTKRLQDQVMDSSFSVPSRAEAVTLLQRLNHPVESMIEVYLAAHWDRLLRDLGVAEPTMANKLKGWLGLEPRTADTKVKRETPGSPQKAMEQIEEDFIDDFIETATTYRALFPTGEKRLTEAATNLFDQYFASVQKSLQPEIGIPSATELIAALGVLSKDVTRLNELVPEAGLPDRASKAVEDAVRQHVAMVFDGLCYRIQVALVLTEAPPAKAGVITEQPRPLKASLENGQRTIIQGSLDVLQDLKELLDNGEEYLMRWRDEYIDLIQAGFQELFTKLLDHFQSLCNEFGSFTSEKQQSGPAATPSLVLLLALLSVYIYQTAVPKITEVVGAWFIGGGAMGYEARPAFVPSEICRFFYATADKLLNQYVNVQSRKLSLLVRKSVSTPQWLKYKEPRDVRMFADLLLQEVEILEGEVQQLLDPGSARMHRRTDSSGSAGSSRSMSMRNDSYRGGAHRSSISNRVRSRLLERDVAKLFTQRVELFTKIEFTQASVVSAVIKLTLKTFQECVRLQTFNRSGYQQIQLDAHYLRDPLRELVVSEAVVDTLLDEVCSAASERCLDPVPLEIAILDKLVQAKRAKREALKSTLGA